MNLFEMYYDNCHSNKPAVIPANDVLITFLKTQLCHEY